MSVGSLAYVDNTQQKRSEQVTLTPIILFEGSTIYQYGDVADVYCVSLVDYITSELH